MTDRSVKATSRSGPAEDSLLSLIDRMAALVDDTGLSELEIEVGGTLVAVRTASAIAIGRDGAASTAAGPAGGMAGESAAAPSVNAPLTGIWYSAPTPGSAPYVSVGAEIGAGQVIGLIEAMKLFNEIKSDLGGRVTRVLVENGQLVKARQPLIEIEAI